MKFDPEHPRAVMDRRIWVRMRYRPSKIIHHRTGIHTAIFDLGEGDEIQGEFLFNPVFDTIREYGFRLLGYGFLWRKGYGRQTMPYAYIRYALS